MSKCVIKNLPALHELATTSAKNRRKILEKASLQLIKAIVECIENVLKGNVTLKKSNIKKLKSYKTTICKIFNTKKKLAEKKKAIVQSGGSFLPALLVPVISILAEKLLR